MNWKVPAEPATKPVLLALVMAGGALMVTVKLWVALVPTPLVAVMVTVVVPPAPVGVPLSRPALESCRPAGRVPEVTLKVGAG